MSQLLAIALNTFREAIRNRIFAGLVLFTIGMLVVVAAFSSASLHEEARLMKDMGLFLTSTFSVVIAVFVGVNLLYKEIERKTIYTVAPKPIFRAQFLLGKYLGLAMTLVVQLMVLGAALAALYGFATDAPHLLGWLVALWLGWGALDFLLVIVGTRRLEPGTMGELPVAFDAMRRVVAVVFGACLIGYTVWVLPLAMLQALLLIFVEVLIVTAVAMLFSSFSTPMLSGMLTFGVFIIGRFADRISLADLMGGDEPDAMTRNAEAVLRWIERVLPDLTLYNATPYVVYEQPIPWAYVGQASLYGLTYAAIALGISTLLFAQRDFT